MLHERHVDGVLDRHRPRSLLGIALAREHRLQLGGQPFHLRRLRQHELERLRRVDHAVAEIVRELRELSLDRVEPRLLLGRQRHAGQLRAPRHLREDALPRGRLGRRRLRKLVEPLRLSHAQCERHDLLLVLLLHLAPRLGIGNRKEMRDASPRLPERTRGGIKRAHEAIPRGHSPLLERVDGRLRIHQQLRQSLVRSLRRHRREVGELGDRVERILHVRRARARRASCASARDSPPSSRRAAGGRRPGCGP